MEEEAINIRHVQIINEYGITSFFFLYPGATILVQLLLVLFFDTSVGLEPYMNQEVQTDGAGDAYALTPLSTRPRYIRLLHVEAALHHGDQQDDTDPIRGSLLEADLDANPQYSALSYVWGCEAAKRKAIVIDDNVFNVTENCHAALWHLRHLLGRYTIWIDVICINQEDELEKLTQIALMDVIYKQAEQVYAWLGPNDSFAASSVDILANPAFRTQFNTTWSPSGSLSQSLTAWKVAFNLYFERLHFRESEWARWNKRECTCWSPRSYDDTVTDHCLELRSHSRFESKHLDLHTSVTTGALKTYLVKEWPHRIWTYQEIVLAARPVLICGTSTLCWEDFEYSLVLLHSMDHSEGNYLIDPSLSEAISTWRQIVMDRNAYQDTISSTSRQALLNQYQRFLTGISRRARLINRAHYVGGITAFLIGVGLLSEAFDVQCTPEQSNTPLLFHRSHPGILSASSISPGTCRTSMGLLAAAMAFWTITIYTALILFLIPCFRPLKLPSSTNTRPEAIVQKNVRPAKDEVLRGIITRDATDPKDYNRATRSVIQIHLKDTLQQLQQHASTIDHFRDLTINMLDITGLTVVVAAAAPGCRGQPSWIPDWSQDLPLFWLEPFGPETSLDAASSNVCPGSQVRANVSSFESVDLHLDGICLGAVSTVFKLQATSPVYKPEDDAIHIQNLDALLQMVDVELLNNDGRHLSGFGDAIAEEGVRLFSNPPFDKSSTESGATFLDFLKSASKLPAEDVFRLYTKALSASTTWLNRIKWFLLTGQSPNFHCQMLQKQIDFCNRAAADGISYFHFQSTAWPHTSIYSQLVFENIFARSKAQSQTIGMAMRNVRRGDDIMLFSGVPTPIITREERNHAQTLVSPAAIVGVMSGQAWNNDGHSCSTFVIN